MADNERCAISIIKGGLGNQLFTYAAGRAYAERTGRRYYVDTKRGFTHDSYGRKYLLNRFPISAEEMPESWRVAPTLKHYRHKLVRAWNKYQRPARQTYIAQRWDTGGEQLIGHRSDRKRVLINGYWNDEAFFADCADIIREELAPPKPGETRNLDLGAKFAETPDSVFLHLRRVRYQTLLPAEYYQGAIEQLVEETDQPMFVVFGDDLSLARENLDFRGREVVWMEHNSDDEIADLWLMTRCRHAIIANSSFSWWGAWLGAPASSGRIVFGPYHPDWVLDPAEGWRRIDFAM